MAAFWWCASAQGASKEFRNCGLSAKFSGGSDVTVIVSANLTPVSQSLIHVVQATPRQRFTVPTKWDQGSGTAGAGFRAGTTVQVAVPPFPDNYDATRKASWFAAAVSCCAAANAQIR